MQDDSDEFLDLLNGDHFATLQVDLQITNSTTRMPFRTDPPSQLIEITEHGMVLEVPARSCAQHHNLVIDALARPPRGEPVRLAVTARVDEVEDVAHGVARIALSFIQVREEEWSAFRAVFSSRQDEIDRFLAAAKGV